MADVFHGSWVKVRRANKHIADLHEMLLGFANTDFYSIVVEQDPELRTNFLNFKIELDRFPLDDLALTIGDALHNLRSALDHLYCQVVLECGGATDKWTMFPIRNEGHALIAALTSAFKQKQISAQVVKLIMAGVRPYQGGNPALWGLHKLNVRDKHELLIPVLKLVMVSGVYLEDNQYRRIGDRDYIMGDSSKIRIADADDRNVTVKDRGHADVTILFDIGTPFYGEPVVPTLKRVSEEVTRTIKAFESLLGTDVW